MHDEHGHLDRPQDVANVCIPLQALEDECCSRACRDAKKRCELSAKIPVADVGWPGFLDQVLGELIGTPSEIDARQVLVPLFGRPRPREVWRPESSRCCAMKRYCKGPRGVRRREDRTEHRPILVSEKGCSLDPGRVHDRADVVHSRLECRQISSVDAIGQSGTAPVKQDHPCEGRQAPKRASKRRHAPHVLHVRRKAGSKDEVEGTRTEHLVRNVRPIWCLDVLGLRIQEAEVEPSHISQQPNSRATTNGARSTDRGAAGDRRQPLLVAARR